MSTLSKNPLRKAQPERREELVRHFIQAIEPVIEAGTAFTDLSVEQIIRAGGISRATFYAYFDDKGDLLRAMALGVGQDISATGIAWWDIVGDEVSEETLREGFRPAIDAYMRHRVLMRSVAEMAAYDPKVREVYGQLMRDTTEHLTVHITDRLARGLLPADTDAARTATWIVWMLERGLYQAVSVEPESAEAWLNSVVRIVWSALYNRA